MTLPKRKHLSRLRTIFRLPVGEVYLLTVNCAKRRCLFVDDARARIVLDTLTEYAARRGYALLLCTVLPDHVHAVVAASDAASGLSKLVNNWKTWCTRRLREAGVEGDVWQNEFFDHRIRSEESLADKCEYVVHNPIRAGLVERPEDWPHTSGFWWDEYRARRSDVRTD